MFIEALVVREEGSPKLSSDTATTPVAASHNPVVTSIIVLKPEFVLAHSRHVPIAS
jgi:hypothetical protein